MPSTTQAKQHTLTQVLTVLKRQYEPTPLPDRPVLEHLLYGVLREGATRDQTDRAYKNLTERFYDWNEVRVSSPQEVEAALEDLPDAAAKAPRIVGILGAVFEWNFSFDLDEVGKKGLKNAVKQIQEKVADVNDFVIAWVVQQALGGHAIPLDAQSKRVLNRLGVIEGDAAAESAEAARAALEHLVPKAKGPMFHEMISQLARDVCWEEEPHCGSCAVRGDCPTGQTRKAAEPRPPRLKPR
jgi:endonuclease III